jgi:hypothetical protein
MAICFFLPPENFANPSLYCRTNRKKVYWLFLDVVVFFKFDLKSGNSNSSFGFLFAVISVFQFCLYGYMNDIKIFLHFICY